MPNGDNETAFLLLLPLPRVPLLIFGPALFHWRINNAPRRDRRAVLIQFTDKEREKRGKQGGREGGGTSLLYGVAASTTEQRTLREREWMRERLWSWTSIALNSRHRRPADGADRDLHLGGEEDESINGESEKELGQIRVNNSASKGRSGRFRVL